MYSFITFGFRLITAACLIGSAHSFPSTGTLPRASTEFINILSNSGRNEKLPAALAKFPLWILDGDSLVRVPDALPNVKGGWVEPRSINSVWIPEKSERPSAVLGVALLIKDGLPRYLMPALDVYLDKNDKRWRNRGLNTVALAHTWQQFDFVPLTQLAISGYMSSKDAEEAGTTEIWGEIQEKVDISAAVETLVRVIADLPEDLSRGNNVLLTALPQASPFPLPASTTRIRVFLTDYPSPVRLLEVMESGGAELDVEVIEVADASKSEFLPDVYKPLFR